MAAKFKLPSMNPFKRAKHATNKDGLLTRLKDTYDVLVGSPNAEDVDKNNRREDLESKFYSTTEEANSREKAHIGLFDIASVFSLALIEAGMIRLIKYTKRDGHKPGALFRAIKNPKTNHKENFKTFLAGVGIYLLAIPYLPLKLVSVVFGLVGTLITLPITLLLVHPIAKRVQAYRNRKQLKDLKNTEFLNNTEDLKDNNNNNNNTDSLGDSEDSNDNDNTNHEKNVGNINTGKNFNPLKQLGGNTIEKNTTENNTNISPTPPINTSTLFFFPTGGNLNNQIDQETWRPLFLN